MIRLLALTATTLLAALILTTPAKADSQFIGSHSMLKNDTPFSAKEEMFRQAKESGASTIRVDIFLQGIFQKGFWGNPDIYWQNWSGVDEYKTLAEKYNIDIVAIILGNPHYNVSCPSGWPAADSYHCRPKNLVVYKQMVAEVVQRYQGVIDYYEIVNEPDLYQSFPGTPAQYADVLAAGADAVHENSQAKVLNGGLARMSSSGFAFFDSILKARPDLVDKIDICNIHIRGNTTSVVDATKKWSDYCRARSIANQTWVTEYGYPADPAQQTQSGYKSGEVSQAKFIKDSVPKMVSAGGDKIFVTLRDWGGGWFASEGILDSDDPLVADPVVRRRSAFTTVQNLFPEPIDSGVASSYASRFSPFNSPLTTLTDRADLLGGSRRYRVPISPCFTSKGIQASQCSKSGVYAEILVNSKYAIISYRNGDKLLYSRGGALTDNIASWSHVTAAGNNAPSAATIEAARGELRNALSQSIINQRELLPSPGVAVNILSQSTALKVSSQRLVGHFSSSLPFKTSYKLSGAICAPSCASAQVSLTNLTAGTLFTVARNSPATADRICGQTETSRKFVWQPSKVQVISGQAEPKTLCL